MAPPEGTHYALTDAGPLGPSRKHQRCVVRNKGTDKGAVERAAQVDVNADSHAD